MPKRSPRVSTPVDSLEKTPSPTLRNLLKRSYILAGACFFISVGIMISQNLPQPVDKNLEASLKENETKSRNEGRKILEERYD